MSVKKKNIGVEIFKILIIILIPLIFIEFIIYANISPKNFNYLYEIGSNEDNYLSPAERISEQINNTELNYRNLIDQLVYFDIPTIKGTDKINLEIKFKDNFPDNSKFLLGAKDQEEWHYKSTVIYDKTIEDLMLKYPYSQKDNLKLFKLNSYSPDYTINDFETNPPLVKLSTSENITIPEFKIKDYQPESFAIDTALRGTLTFYIYAKDYFNVEVWKRDLNMYENEDELNISLYDLDNNFIASEIIEDDGEDDKASDKNNTDIQKEELEAFGLKEGVYKLELKNNDDMLITKIKLNQNKIVLKNTLFLAQSGAYFNNFEEDSRIYFKTQKPLLLTAQTWHDYALQTIYIDDQKLKIKEVNEKFTLDLKPSDNFYILKSEINDIKITGPEFFSFTEDSWFDPFEGKNVQYKNNLEYLEKNADYVLVDYVSPINKDGWKIASLSLDIEEDNLYIKDDKLSMLFNVGHLNKNETKQNQIPIDWINITVHKKGSFK
jgi:hypothetical protein